LGAKEAENSFFQEEEESKSLGKTTNFRD